MVQHYSIIFFLFFSRTFLRAEDHVLWALLSQERHYLLLCSFSPHCFSNWVPETSRGPLWGPTMLTLKQKNNLVQLLFHVLDINSVREAMAVWLFRFIPSAAWKERQVFKCCLLWLVHPKIHQWLHRLTSEQTHHHKGDPSNSLVVTTHQPQVQITPALWLSHLTQC